MTVRFLADEDLHGGLINGLQSREPVIDVLNIKITGPRGLADPDLLDLAAAQERCLITHDRRTMTRHFLERVSMGKSTPGIFIVHQQKDIGETIESLLLVWAASEAEEWRDQIVYLPFR